MKTKTLILMVVAVACGLGASYMTSKLIAERKAPPAEEKVRLLVTKTKVPKFTVLDEPEKFFELRERSKGEAPKDFFNDFSQVKGKRLNKELKAGVHVSQEDIQDKLSDPLQIPDGHQALALKITAESAAAFFIRPGDKVDILWTQRGPNPSTLPIFQDVLVLAVGDFTTAPDDPNRNTMQANTVTVALTPYDANLVTLARSQGEINLVLRKGGDDTTRQVRGATLEDLKRTALMLREKHGGTEPDPVTELPPITKGSPGGVEPDPIPVVKRPDWKIRIERGAYGGQDVKFWKQGDGWSTEQPDPIFVTPRKQPKKEEKKEEKSEENKPATQPEN